MLKPIFTFILILVTAIASLAQTDTDAIRFTLNKYLKGSSYNDRTLISEAFHDEAKLYLTDRNNEFRAFTVDDYTGWFDESKSGQFNGRIGNILSINRFEDIAFAKAEILMPQRQWRFIDMFILKKIDNEWKIVSKTAGRESSKVTGKRILFIVSNVNRYGNSELATGNSFSELVNAYDAFTESGYHVDLVSPQGGAIPLAYINPAVDMHMNYLYNDRFMYALSNTYKPGDIDPSKYSAVHYIGGGSAMYEVPRNQAIQDIAMSIYEDHNGVVSSVCHGTAGIVYLKKKNGEYLVKDKRISGYPESLENQDSDYFKTFPFLIQHTIEDHGGTFKHSERGMAHVEQDGRIVSGQNHLSSRGVALKTVEIIESLSINR